MLTEADSATECTLTLIRKIQHGIRLSSFPNYYRREAHAKEDMSMVFRIVLKITKETVSKVI